MPTKGNFSVELVDANTKVAFKEFPGSNGVDAYVEVEPNLEYFVQDKSDYPKGYILAEIQVDGVHLGYICSNLEEGKIYKFGVWSYNAITSQSVNTALQVHKAVSHSALVHSEDVTETKSDVGMVEVLLYEDIQLEGNNQMEDVVLKFAGTSPVIDSQHHTYTKHLKSLSGEKQEFDHDNGIRRNYKRGNKLDSIKVRYCSTVGLIENGVLPKPPLWEWHRMLNSKKDETIQSELQIQPTQWKYELRDNNGNIVKTVESDFFDLTNLEEKESIAC